MNLIHATRNSCTCRQDVRNRWPRFFCATVCIATLALVPSAPATTGKTDLFDMSMDQLSEVEIKSDIASIRAKPIEEQPGIVSVVTAKQIQETGARDLSDILMLVPGFSLDTDVESMIGLTFRGLQAQEGKALLILDGIEVNEPLYGSLPILNHIPADAIEQVEIIRGPGSAQYGGMAGLAVIRVTTKGASQNGGYAVATPSWADHRFSELFTAGIGYTKGDWRFSVDADYNNTYLSNRKYTALNGTQADLPRHSDMNPYLFDVGAGWRDLDVRIIYDYYHYNDLIDFGETVSPPNDTGFDSLLTSAKYELRPNDWLKITPQFVYRSEVPWYVNNSSLGKYDIETYRYEGDLNAIADLNDNSSLLVGMRFQRDSAYAKDASYYGQTNYNYYFGQSSIAYDDIAGYAQYDLDTRWVNVSLGGRYEDHDAIGGHFVPRVALTKAWDKFHVKLLYSQAYRTPGINVIQESHNLQAEHTSNYELETGYKFPHGISWVGNVFYMKVEKPIIFFSTTNGATEFYTNGKDISTYGLESELRWEQPKFSSYLSYSFYQAGENDELYVRGDDSRFLGTPTHKVSWSETWHMCKKVDWNVSGFWISQRLAFAFPSAGVTELDPEFILNTFVDYHTDHFSFGLGAANLLDQDRFAPQPYAGGSGPVPLKGREFFVKLALKF